MKYTLRTLAFAVFASAIIAWAVDYTSSESLTYRIWSIEPLTESERASSPNGSWGYRFNYEVVGREDVHLGIVVTKFGFNPFLNRTVSLSNIDSFDEFTVTKKYRTVALPYLAKTKPSSDLATIFDGETNGIVFFGPGNWNGQQNDPEPP